MFISEGAGCRRPHQPQTGRQGTSARLAGAVLWRLLVALLAALAASPSAANAAPSTFLGAALTGNATGSSKDSINTNTSSRGINITAPVLASSLHPNGCNTSLLEVVEAARDLTLINLIQNATGVDFFLPYGPRSTRVYTVIVPSDRAIINALAGVSNDTKGLEALERSFTALLLYHQILDAGYNKYRIVREDRVQTALGSALRKSYYLTPALDNVTYTVTDAHGKAVKAYNESFMLIGMAPNNTAFIKRQHQACNAYMLVVDTLLRPVADLKALPSLAATQPSNSSMWKEIEAAVQLAALANDTSTAADDSDSGDGDSNGGDGGDGSSNSTSTGDSFSPDAGSGGNSSYADSSSASTGSQGEADLANQQDGQAAASTDNSSSSSTADSSGGGGNSSKSTTLVLAVAAASVGAAAVATVGLFIAIRRRAAHLKKQESKLTTDDENVAA